MHDGAPQEKHEPPNPNFWVEGEDEGHATLPPSAVNLFHFNRKFLLDRVRDADKPPFKTPNQDEKVEFIQPISDADIDGDGSEGSGMDLKACQKELNRRGYSKPPYTVQVEQYKVTIQKEGLTPSLLLNGNPETTATETGDMLDALVKACGEHAKADLADGKSQLLGPHSLVHTPRSVRLPPDLCLK